jgi:hypothetical protein
MRMHPRRLGCFWILAVAIVASTAGATVVVDQPVHDFGSVERGTPVEHVFRLRNTGTAPMRVDHVKGTCACTVGVATGEPIAPGDEAWVTVRLETDRLAGKTTKIATVYTNDPDTPTIPVTLRGAVLADLLVNPTAVYLGHVRQGAVVRKEIAVTTGRPGGTDSVLGVASAPPHVKAWVEAGADGIGQRVVVELTADGPVGRFADDLVLKTSSAGQPTLTVKVLGTIEG